MKQISGRVALVTGGASGIGRGIARALAREGAKVVVADIDGEAATSAANELRKSGTATGIALDVTDPGAWERVADQVETEVGPVAILCSNAGVGGAHGPAETVSLDEWRWVFAVNVDAHLMGVRAFLPRMKARGGEGHLLQTISMAGLVATPNASAYGASKHAAMGLARILRAELAGTEIGVSVICPGMVRTNLPLSALKARPANLPPRKMGEVEGMAKVLSHGMDPDLVGARAVRAIQAGEFYVLTHADWKPIVEAQEGEVSAAFGESADPSYRDNFDALADVSGRIPGSDKRTR
jgi:NAD(P)-dependent dehydrogenase (short-subunit alcohol dehydrogenase family)